MSTQTAPTRRPSPGLRRAAAGALAVVVVVVALALAAVSVDATLLVHRMPTLAVTPPGSGGGTAYLLLASDSRERLSGRDRRQYADRTQSEGERADLVLVLRRPAGGEPRLVSIPRDLFVGAAAGSPHRLGMALGDGPQAMVTSLCTDLGIGVDHVAILHFRGLIDLVD
ncbi:MAG TPA: hypothetical protein VFX53_08550, partial [Pedococcus sp.]|nr:hypothetical protein [Pedococcus sp.]